MDRNEAQIGDQFLVVIRHPKHVCQDDIHALQQAAEASLRDNPAIASVLVMPEDCTVELLGADGSKIWIAGPKAAAEARDAEG